MKKSRRTQTHAANLRRRIAQNRARLSAYPKESPKYRAIFALIGKLEDDLANCRQSEAERRIERGSGYR